MIATYNAIVLYQSKRRLKNFIIMNPFKFTTGRLIVILICLFAGISNAQEADSLNIYKSRQKLLNIAIPSTYTAGSFALYFAWYKDHPRESFHFFNDLKEWEGVDKAGHMYSSYTQTDILFDIFQWAGHDRNKALNRATIWSFCYQSTIELMDGFSSDWGFSVADITANLLGNSLFIAQEKLWSSQRIRMKMSAFPKSYSTDPINSETGLFSTSLKSRAYALYGSSWPERFLKDYNAQTIWLSTNPKDWNKDLKWPQFLSLAIGYGADNMYGGFYNRWEINDENFILDQDLYPRHKQFLIAMDYDLTKIKTKSLPLRSLFKVLNAFKWPAPALELKSNGEIKFHLIFLN